MRWPPAPPGWTWGEMRADLDRFRREIGVDHIDVVLLHFVSDADWPRRKAGAMVVFSEAKARGVVRAHGVSCHSLGALEAAAAADWVDVVLARLNPVGAHMDADPATVVSVLRRTKARGKGVIGMKLLAQGELRERVDEALQFALAQDVGRAGLLHDRRDEPRRARGPDPEDPAGERPGPNRSPAGGRIRSPAAGQARSRAARS